MFGIGGWEFVFIAGLALLLFGPDKLPQLARTLGRFMRDFKRYQNLMESTIRGEIFAADPQLQKDPFETGREFRTKVAGGGFSKPGAAAEKVSAESEPAAEETPGEETPVVEAAPEEPLESAISGEIVSDELLDSAITGEIALDEPDELPSASDDGEGERSEA